MRKNLGAKPLTYPQPVHMIGTYDAEGRANLMNAAWGGMSGRTEMFFCLAKMHKTVKNILLQKEFTVSMATEKTLVACDYLGIVSGNQDPEKLAKTGFHAKKAEFVNAPIFEELPMSLELRLLSYDENTEIARAEIVNVSIEEAFLKEGKIDVEALAPILFDPAHMAYRRVGEIVGKAFSDGKKLK